MLEKISSINSFIPRSTFDIQEKIIHWIIIFFDDNIIIPNLQLENGQYVQSFKWKMKSENSR